MPTIDSALVAVSAALTCNPEVRTEPLAIAAAAVDSRKTRRLMEWGSRIAAATSGAGMGSGMNERGSLHCTHDLWSFHPAYILNAADISGEWGGFTPIGFPRNATGLYGVRRPSVRGVKPVVSGECQHADQPHAAK